MGGWNAPKEGSNVCRSSYNGNMDAQATAQLLEMANEERVAVVLYSSHVLARDLGLSINGNNFPNLITKITESKAPGIEKFRKAGESWDTHLVQCYEKLKDVVGPHKGRQFTPADPMTVMGYL
ncbi:hypothetical protein niasHS_010527 [Heterodera schachtii]|uniref:Uncharacterized protein n=1 Tax=Heterodera schachtii TaxID=97005 RepID=A0ABD2IZH9_HETSC